MFEVSNRGKINILFFKFRSRWRHGVWCRRAGKGLFFKMFQSLHVQAVGFLVEVLHDLDVISTAEDLCQSILHQSPYFFIRSRRRRFGSCSFHQFPDDIELWIFFPVVIQQVHGGKPHRDIIGQTDKLSLVDRLQEFP